jgi:hypothetical protein
MTLNAPQNLPKPLEDEARMADAGHRAQAQHHLLVDIENWNQQRHRPEQRRAVILARLAVGREGASVVVAGHDDEAGAEDGKQRRQPMLPSGARADIAVKDGSEGAVDVADMRGVENGGLDSVGNFDIDRHGSSPFAVAGSRDEPSDDQSARVGAGAEAVFPCRLKEEEPGGRDRAGPTGQLGPSFKSVSSIGRERDAGSKARAVPTAETPLRQAIVA